MTLSGWKIWPLALLLTCFSTAAMTAEPSAYEKKYTADPFYQEIVTASETLKGQALINFIYAKLDESWAKRVHPASIWLRRNSTGQFDAEKTHANYFLAYAEVLKPLIDNYALVNEMKTSAELQKVALQSLYIFEAMATADAVRCVDDTALAAVQFSFLPYRDYIKTSLGTLGVEPLSDFAKTALLFEDNALERAGNADICMMGDLAHAAQQAGRAYQPAFLPQRGWTPQRAKALKDLQATWKMRHEFWAQLTTE